MKNKLIKIILVLVITATVYSLVPVAVLYLKGNAIAVKTNETVVGSLKANKGNYFAFIVFGDNHAGLIFDDSAALKIIGRMNSEDRFKKFPIDFVLSTGDVTFRGSAWDYRIYDRIRSQIKWPVISGIGNHDDDRGGAPRFKEHIGGKEFSFIDRNSYFIVIDDSINDLTNAQFLWIEEELKKASEYSHKFIIMHKSPISVYQQSWYRPGLSRWSYRFMKLCEKHKVDIVFSGHQHMFGERKFGGVRYAVSGGGGMLNTIPTQDGGYLNYLVVRVNGDYVDFEVRKIFPPVWEFFTYYMWKDIFYFLKDAIF